jgi:hypothetical protein
MIAKSAATDAQNKHAARTKDPVEPLPTNGGPTAVTVATTMNAAMTAQPSRLATE